MAVILETANQYKTIRLEVSECESIKDAEGELQNWLNQKKELVKNATNKEILKLVFE